MTKLAGWTSLLVPLTLVVLAFAAMDSWLIANGLERHLEAGRSVIWLAALLTGAALGYGLGKMKLIRRQA